MLPAEGRVFPCLHLQHGCDLRVEVAGLRVTELCFTESNGVGGGH